MTTAGTPLAGPTPVPSVPKQVLRATVGTLAVLLVVGLSVGAWATWGTAFSGKVFSITGDPRVGLADGVTLSTTPRTVAVPQLSAVTWSPATEAAAIARGTGVPVHRLDAAALVALEPHIYDIGSAARSIADGRRYYATPLGIVQVATPTPDSGFTDEQVAVLRHPSPDVRRLTGDAQKDLVKRLTVAWGVGGSAAQQGGHVEVSRNDNGPTTLQAHLWLPGTDGPCGSCSGGWAMLDKGGSVATVFVNLETVVDTHPVHVMSAQAAFDALRHHAEGTYLTVDSLTPGQTVPGRVTTATLWLMPDPTATTSPLASVAAWDFSDADGNLVGSVLPGKATS